MLYVYLLLHDRSVFLVPVRQKVRRPPRPTFLPCLYEANPEDDWLDVKTWKKANPALGEFRSLEDMKALANRAKESPALENSFRRLYLNQWTSSETAWIPADKWAACGGLIVPERLKGRECLGGLDLSATTDLAALF